jgi:hypothetical protein
VVKISEEQLKSIEINDIGVELIIEGTKYYIGKGFYGDSTHHMLVKQDNIIWK